MELVLDASRENGWHREWMNHTPSAYEWWYMDIVSDDRVWTLVTIFLLGNPFSPYYRLCRRGQPADPLTYNAVYFALHRGGKLHHYLFATYSSDQLRLLSNPIADVKLGQSRFARTNDAGYAVAISEVNANNRQLDAAIALSSLAIPNLIPEKALPAADHWWLPAVASGVATVDIRIASPGVSSEVEKIQFRGSGYHDHNWGTLPFESSLSNWTWCRVDFGRGTAAIIYWIVETDGKSNVTMVFYRQGTLAMVDRCATVTDVRRRFTRFASSFPSSFTVNSGDVSVAVLAADLLENVPFYVRFRVASTCKVGSEQMNGVGVGEYIKPATMGLAPTGWGMSRRIYRPSTGS